MTEKPTWFEDVLQFHVHGEHVINNEPCIPNQDTIALRKRLILEEVEETIKAIDDNDLESVADGIIDSMVVLIGTGISYGMDLHDLWDEVHKSNMMKFKDGIQKDAGGKTIKPKGWEPPDLKAVLDTQENIKDKYALARTKELLWTECEESGCIYRGHYKSATSMRRVCDKHDYGD